MSRGPDGTARARHPAFSPIDVGDRFEFPPAVEWRESPDKASRPATSADACAQTDPVLVIPLPPLESPCEGCAVRGLDGGVQPLLPPPALAGEDGRVWGVRGGGKGGSRAPRGAKCGGQSPPRWHTGEAGLPLPRLACLPPSPPTPSPRVGAEGKGHIPTGQSTCEAVGSSMEGGAQAFPVRRAAGAQAGEGRASVSSGEDEVHVHSPSRASRPDLDTPLHERLGQL